MRFGRTDGRPRSSRCSAVGQCHRSIRVGERPVSKFATELSEYRKRAKSFTQGIYAVAHVTNDIFPKLLECLRVALIHLLVRLPRPPMPTDCGHKASESRNRNGTDLDRILSAVFQEFLQREDRVPDTPLAKVDCDDMVEEQVNSLLFQRPGVNDRNAASTLS